jgi:hypothetical protein
MKKWMKHSEISNLVDYFCIVFIVVIFIAFFLIFKYQGEAYEVNIDAKNREVVGDFILNSYLRLERPRPAGNGVMTNAEVIAHCVKDNDCDDKIIIEPLEKYMEVVADDLPWSLGISKGDRQIWSKSSGPSAVSLVGPSDYKIGVESIITIPPVYAPDAELIKVRFAVLYKITDKDALEDI